MHLRLASKFVEPFFSVTTTSCMGSFMLTGTVLDKPVASGLEQNVGPSHHQDALMKVFLEEDHSRATSVCLNGHSLLPVLIDTVMRTDCAITATNLHTVAVSVHPTMST